MGAPQVRKPEPRSLKGFKLVGVVGKARTGKDTLGAYLKGKRFLPHRDLYATTAALADGVKAVASKAFDIPLNYFYEHELKDAPFDDEEFSPRQIAQYVGTESFRDVFGEWVWVKRLHTELQSGFNVNDAVVVTDVRFANEVQWICEQDGIVVYLEREDAPQVSAHSSENIPSLEDCQYMEEQYGGDLVHIPNNRSKQDFYAEIEARLVPLLMPDAGETEEPPALEY